MKEEVNSLVNLNQEVKEALDKAMPKESIFSEFEKQQVQNRINIINKSSFKSKRYLFPKTLTMIAVIGFLFLMGSIVNDHLFTTPENKSSNIVHTEKNSQFKLPLDKDNKILLPSSLQNKYENFAETKNGEMLEGLTPFEVFQFYYYAEEHGDYETQYALYITDGQYIKAFDSFAEYLKSKQESKGRNDPILNKIKTTKLKEVIVDETAAYISISEKDGIGFGLSKDHSGIWRVNWLPLQ